MKLRATKAETNGTVKPAEPNPVSISASLCVLLFLFSMGRRNPAEARFCAVDGSFSLFTSSFFFPVRVQDEELKWVEDNIPSSLADV